MSSGNSLISLFSTRNTVVVTVVGAFLAGGLKPSLAFGVPPAFGEAAMFCRSSSRLPCTCSRATVWTKDSSGPDR